ncbi:hypothetical protein G210_4814 [Candida maltosa Xu316]|uniref:Uncharacterized protein n=1 Tax=Candida maltosa (strain Xu316) TaxID=1245528 RepID=M3IU95_CANMX|nr:hypothetical protein G210_4814 [Candida maltosa Xu316]
MIFKYIYLLVLINALLLPPEWPNIIKPTLLSLKETKSKLFSSLQFLMPTENPYFNISTANVEPTPDDDEGTGNLLFIPRELINPTMFQTLGLLNLVSDQVSNMTSMHWFNLTSSDQLLIPDVFKTFFIFNTTQKSLLNPLFKNYQNQNHQINNLNKFLIKSIPFDMPNLLNLVDYYMVVPELPHLMELKNLTSLIYSKSVINIPSEYLPIFRNQLSERKPMIVFMFNETSSSTTTPMTISAASPPIISIKNYLSSASISAFFDKFANIWLKQVNYDSLIHAVYCNVNPSDQVGSYCLKIQDHMIHVLPAFKKSTTNTHHKHHQEKESKDLEIKSQSVSQENEKMEENDEVQTQALRQIHDKISVKKNKAKLFAWGFAKEPKPTVEKLDEIFDDKMDAKKTKLINTKDAFKESLDLKKNKFLDTFENKLDVLDDKTDLIADTVKHKKNDMLVYKLNPRLFEKHYDEIGVDETYDSDYENDNLRKSSIYKTEKSDAAGSTYVNKRNQFYEPTMVAFRDDGFSLPLELLNFDDNNPINLPRRKTYSQLINLSTGKAYKRSLQKRQKQFLANANDKDCQPITWYNIFHYSIFGEPKFCKDEFDT